MLDAVITKEYTALPPCDRREALRYAGVKAGEASDGLGALFDACLAEYSARDGGAVCWCEIPVRETERGVDLGFAVTESRDLKKCLAGCSRAVLFAATAGVWPDRLTAKYLRLSPAKAVVMQGIGAERVECVCDEFCREVKTAYGQCTPRFSPGYGDLPLALQKDIFAVLDCPRRIGVSLGDTLFMTPTKSVTAIVGIRDKNKDNGGQIP